MTDGNYNNSAITTSTNATNITNFDGALAANTTDNVTVTHAALAVSKITSTPTAANTATGTTAAYTMTVTNNGSSGATGVVLTDTLPSGFTYNGGASTVTLSGVALTAAQHSETRVIRG